MLLSSGLRYTLSDDNKLIRITEGKLELYAVTKEKIAGGRIFLRELSRGDVAFPATDEFQELVFELLATTDTKLEEIAYSSLDKKILVSYMQTFLFNITEISWVEMLIERGDNTFVSWKNGSSLFLKDKNTENIISAFQNELGIFVALLLARIAAENGKWGAKLAMRRKQNHDLVDQTIGLLLGEDVLPEDSESLSGARFFEETLFLVRIVAKSLSMPTEGIHLSPETSKRLNQRELLTRLTQKGGMNLRLVKLEPGWQKDDCGAMAGYYGKNKTPVALIPESPQSYKMVSKEHPKGVAVTEEIAGELFDEAYVFYAGLPPRKLSNKDLGKFILNHSFPKDLWTIVLASLAAGLLPLVTPIVTETIFQDIIPIFDREGLATVTQVVMVSGFTVAALSVVRSFAFLRLNMNVDLSLEAAMLSRILSMPTQFFRKYESGNIAARMQGLGLVSQLISGDMAGIILSFLCSFWSLILMCYYSWKLTAVGILLWAGYLLVTWLFMGKLLKYQKKHTEAANNTAGILQQIFAGLAKFRMRGAEAEAYNLWGKAFAEEWKWNYALRLTKNYSTVLTSAQPILLSFALYYYAFNQIAEVKDATLTLATFIAFQSAYTAFNLSLTTAIPALEEMMIIKPLLENLQPLLEAEPEDAEEKPEAGALRGAIELRHVSFAYEEGLPYVLDDLNFSIKPGENVAIVGKSGCGKSTLIRLLMGFEKPAKGAVYYDGYDLNELALPSVRSQLGVVLQGGQLMPGDIFRNITGINNLSQDDAWEAAKAAGVDEDIRQMPMGMQTMISEGSTAISGGQKQRILIARALAMKPAVIIFDEATSALDNRTQAIVTESLNKMKATRIVVAHRLSTIRNVDRIIVLDGGKVAESGTFDELAAAGGIFSSLVKRQVA